MIEIGLWSIWTDRESRTGKRLTYAEVSKHTGLAVETLRRVKLGTAKRFDLNTLDRLCHFFECQIQDLLVYVPPGD